MNIINSIINFIRKPLPVPAPALDPALDPGKTVIIPKYIPFQELHKFEQVKILGQIEVTRKSIESAKKRYNLPIAKIELLNGLKRGFILDITDHVNKFNQMPDPVKLLDNYQTIPGFIETFELAGITRDEMLNHLIILTGSHRHYGNSSY